MPDRPTADAPRPAARPLGWLGHLLALAAASSALASPSPVAERGFLTDHTQLTSSDRFVKAGEAYFDPSGTWIIFQAVPVPPAGQEPSAHYEMFVAKLDRDARTGDIRGLAGEPIQLSSAGSANTCGWFHPTEPGVVLFGSTRIPPADENTPGYSRDRSRYTWLFPREMDVVTHTIPAMVEDLVADADERETLLSRDDVDAAKPIWEQDGYCAEASWSPDGRAILYTAVDPETRDGDLFAYIPETHEHRPIVRAPGYDGGPFFSPDGRFICYRSDRRGDNLLQLFVAELEYDDNGLPAGIAHEYQLTDNGHVNWAPFWHPSGRYLVYATSQVSHLNYEVFAIPFDPENPGAHAEPVRVTHADGFDGLPVFDADGSHMMWTAQRSGDGASQLWVARTTRDTPPGLNADSTAFEDPIASALAESDDDTRRYNEHVTVLASRWMDGRLPGSAGIAHAESYITFWFDTLGLKPAFSRIETATSDQEIVTPNSTWRQAFEMAPGMRTGRFGSSDHAEQTEPVRAITAYNLGGVLPGRGKLRDEYIIVAAHHDHLGHGRFASRGQPGKPHLGADDNASGVSGVLLLAELLSQTYAELPGDADARSVLFLTFSGEESGLVGSRYFVEHPPVPLDRCALMVNLDMIGRITGNTINLAGVNSGEGLADLVAAAAREGDIDVATPATLSGRSDHASFYDANVPVLFAMITEFHDDYHSHTDLSWKIDRSAAVRTVRTLHDIVLSAAEHDGGFAFTPIDGAGSDAAAAPRMGEIKVRFGIMPGNYADPKPGIAVERVTPDTSAALGGVLAGDRLMTWDGKPVENIGQWMGYLSQHEPGDIVKVGVDREGERVVLDVKLLGRDG